MTMTLKTGHCRAMNGVDELRKFRFSDSRNERGGDLLLESWNMLNQAVYSVFYYTKVILYP